MSGGHFEYNQFRIDDITDEIDELIEANNTPKRENYPPEVIERFKVASKTLKVARKMAHEIDWLVCGDTGTDSFIKRWNLDRDEELKQDAGPGKWEKRVTGTDLEPELKWKALELDKRDREGRK